MAVKYNARQYYFAGGESLHLEPWRRFLSLEEATAKPIRGRAIISTGTAVYQVLEWEATTPEVENQLNHTYAPVITTSPWKIGPDNAYVYPKKEKNGGRLIFVRITAIPGLYGFLVRLKDVGAFKRA